MPEFNDSLFMPTVAQITPNAEWGGAIDHGVVLLGRAGGVELWGVISIANDDAIAFLKASAASELPPGTRFEIRKKVPDNYGRTKGMAWYRNIGFDADPDWGQAEPGWKPAAGYELVSQCVTPAEEAESA